MRVANSLYYNNLFSPNKDKLSNALFNVNKQISSGLKIEYAKDDVGIFSDTMRLDNEINTLNQAKESTSSALKMATQTDTTLNEFQTTLDRMKVLMVNAANASQNDESRDAIYKELSGLKKHLKNLANTSINGQFIFSGSALDTKPIDNNGKYHGNDKELKAFGGSDIQIQYNITGSELFLGEESQRHRKITTNVKNLNQNELYPDVMKDSSIPRTQGKEVYITENDTIRDLMGDSDTDTTNNNPYYFFVSGTNHDGETFSKKLKLDGDQTISELTNSIAELYGHNNVNVALNEHGQIEIEDKIQGSSKLDFHMVGAVDFDLDGNGSDNVASVTALEDLEKTDAYIKGFTKSQFSGNTPNVRSIRSHINTNNFSINGEFIEKPSLQKATPGTKLTDVFDSDVTKIHLGGTDVNGNAVNTDFDIAGKTVRDLISELNNKYDDEANGNDYLSFYFEDGKIKFDSSDATASDNIDIELEARNANNTNHVKGFDTDSFLSYDKVDFVKENDELFSNIPQIVKKDNSYATDSTKLSEVADLSKATAGTLDGTDYIVEGYNISGEKIKTTITLKDSGSEFTLQRDSDGDGELDTTQTFSIYNVDGTKTKADDLSYRQFMDVINMSLTNQVPTDDDGDGNISSDEYFKAVEDADLYAKTSFDDKGQITFKELGATTTKAQMMLYDKNSPDSTLTFQANDALSITDPKTDFFAQIDHAIESVRLGRERADGDDIEDPRNLGIQNGIQLIDDLSLHVTKVHAKVGALSNSLQNANQRSELLSVSTKTLRSSVIDTDIAEASLRLNQLTLNYQAMLSTVGRVSKLSLVNYL